MRITISVNKFSNVPRNRLRECWVVNENFIYMNSIMIYIYITMDLIFYCDLNKCEVVFNILNRVCGTLF